MSEAAEPRGESVRARPVSLQHAAVELESGWRRAGDAIVLLAPALEPGTGDEGAEEPVEHVAAEGVGVEPKAIAAELEALLLQLARRGFLLSAQRVVRGGVWAALERAGAASGLGARLRLDPAEMAALGVREADSAARHAVLHSRQPGWALVSCRSHAHLALANFVDRNGRFVALAVGRVLACSAGTELWWGDHRLHAEAEPADG